MAYFDRFDICGAYLALENDWNKSGILIERPSNARRRMSTGFQLHRMGYKLARDACCSFDYLQNDNQREIYCDALARCGFSLDPHDETHAPILAFIKGFLS